MTGPENPTGAIDAALKGIIGLTLLGSRNFCATRHFYFGRATSQTDPARPHYTLGLECPWRIRKSWLIVVGSDDYYEKAEGNADPSWEPGMPGGHLQDQRLAELLGELREGDITTVHPGFVVTAAQLDECGGIRVDLESNYVLEVFPDSGKRMQWILRLPDHSAFVLMNGVVNESKKKAPEQK